MNRILKLGILLLVSLCVAAPGSAQKRGGDKKILDTAQIAWFQQMFASAVADPAGFALERTKNIQRRDAAASSQLNALLGSEMIPVAARYEIDYRLYLSSGQTFAEIRDGLAACMRPNLTSEQICDCLAAYPGDQEFGAGAGDIITSASATNAVQACDAALKDAASMPSSRRARLLAQQARAAAIKSIVGLHWDNGWTKPKGRKFVDEVNRNVDEAIALGYPRAATSYGRMQAAYIENGSYEALQYAGWAKSKMKPIEATHPQDVLMIQDMISYSLAKQQATAQWMRILYGNTTDPAAEARRKLQQYQEFEALQRQQAEASSPQ